MALTPAQIADMDRLMGGNTQPQGDKFAQMDAIAGIKPQATLKTDPFHQIAAGTLAFGQGGMPVFDELGAGIGAGLEKIGLGGITGGNAAPPGASLGDIYDARLANIRQVEKGFSEQHPVLDPALRVAGGVASTVAIPQLRAAMASNPMAAATAYGAAHGFAGGEGEGNRLGSAALGGALGLGGAALAEKVISPLVGKGLSYLASRVPAQEAGVAGGELSTIAKNLKMAGVSPQEYAQRLATSTTDDFAGELGGENLRLLTQAQAKIPSDAMQTAREAMRQRLAEAPQRAQAIIDKTLTPSHVIDDMRANMQAVADKAGERYAAAYNAPPVSREIVADLMDRPDSQQALAAAVRSLANKGQSAEQAGFVLTQDGKYALGEQIPTQTVDQLQRALGDIVQKGRNAVTGKLETEAGLDAETLRKAIVDRLKQANPAYDRAMMEQAAVKSSEDAMMMGRKLARSSTNPTSDAILEAIDQSMPAQAKSYAKAGFAQGLSDMVRDTPMGTGNPAARIAKNTVVDRIKELTGDPEAAANYAKAIMQEKNRIDLAQRGLYGSNTFENMAQALPDSLPRTKMQIVDQAISSVIDKLNAKSNARLAQALYATTPEQKKALAQAILSASGTAPTPGASNIASVLRQLAARTPTLSTGGN